MDDAPRPGRRPAPVDEAHLNAQEEALETAPRELGLGFDTSGRLGAHLQRAAG